MKRMVENLRSGDLIYLVAQGVIGLAAAVFNSLVVYVIIRNRSLHNVNNTLIASLAVADALVGLVGVPATMATTVGLPRNFYGCLLAICVIIVLCMVSINGVAAIAIECLMAVRFPLFHRRHFTLKTAAIFVVVSWVSGTLIGLVPAFGWNLGPPPNATCAFVLVIDFGYMVYFNFFGFFLTPLTIMFVTYCYIYVIIRRRFQEMDLANNTRNPALIVQTKALKQDSKAARRILFLLVLFAVCWLPLHLSNTISYFTGKLCAPCVPIFVLLTYLNSALNPFLYAYGNPKFRKKFLKTILVKATATSTKNHNS